MSPAETCFHGYISSGDIRIGRNVASTAILSVSGRNGLPAELIDGGEILHHAGGCSDNHRCHRLGPAWHIFRRARHQAWVALTSSRHPQPTNTPLQMTKP
jgi:hypothetical protein